MRTIPWLRSLVLIAAAAPLAMAHPGHGETGFIAGVIHPLTGVDHLLTMLAVGLLSARLGGNARWGMPVLFVAGMLVGGLSAFVGVPLPASEWALATSVLVIGTVLALAVPPDARVAGLVIGLVALAHGHAHVAEMSGSASLPLYGAGFLGVTAVLLTAGVVLGMAACRARATSVLRLSGAVCACASIGLFVALMRGG